MIRFAAMSLLICCMANTGQAQFFKRLFNQSSSDCPGGVCPTNQSQNWTNLDGLSARQHVEQVHGVSTAGMSRADIQQHQNDYHNAYGSDHPVRGTARAIVSAPRTLYNAVQTRYGSYGSSGSQTTQSYGSSGSYAASSYGSSGSLSVGKPDSSGHVVISVGEPVVRTSELAPSLLNESSSFGSFQSRRSFKQTALLAAKNKLDSGEWTQDKYDTFRMAIRIPRIAREMEDALAEQAVEDGTVGSLKDIDWDKLLALVEKWLPIFIKLFAADTSQTEVINAASYVSVEQSSSPQVFNIVFNDIAA